jgi:DNA-binding GntR family transcriptional regulator
MWHANYHDQPLGGEVRLAVMARARGSGRGANLAVNLPRIRQEQSYKSKAYAALKQAIIKMDLYGTSEPIMLDEREISERIGVSRTPIREAVAMLEQDGFVRTVPRRGILIVKKTKREIIEMVQAWAALESMAVRLLIQSASDAEIAGLHELMRKFDGALRPDEHLSDYSAANIEFHQMIIGLSKSQVLADTTDNLLLHVRGIRALTIGRHDRAKRSIEDHLAIIAAIEKRDIDRAEKLSRDHTLGLASYVEEHGDEIFD